MGPGRLLASASAPACNHRRRQGSASAHARARWPIGPSPAGAATHARAWPYRSGGDPQFLHHRPHRSRQVHARGPDAPAHRRRGRAADARAVSGPDGHRARARHHDQEPGRPAALAGQRRPRVRAEPDRHPGPRRLLLRGVQVAGRLRGRGPAGGRRAGHRGADPGQPVPGARRRPDRDPGAEQDRPAGRRAGEVRGGDRGPHRLRPCRTSSGSRPRPARASPSC